MSDVPLQASIIKVIGIGGCGINAINRMIETGIHGAEFIAISSDTQELDRSKTDQRLHLASTQKMPPAIGISALMLTISEDDRAHIRALISKTDIVFIVAGMGGGTGTSIAPIVAKITRDLDILTIAVVSTPFLYEGSRTRRADQGIQELSEHADALVIVSNAKLLTEAGMLVSDVFIAANHLMHLVVTGIAESVSAKNFICIDANDLRTIFADAGIVKMEIASASGKERAKVAAEHALANLSKSGFDIKTANSVLINLTATDSLKLKEVASVLDLFDLKNKESLVVVTTGTDDAMGDELRLTLFVTDLADLPESDPTRADELGLAEIIWLDERKAV